MSALPPFPLTRGSWNNEAMKFKLPDALHEIHDRLAEAGHACYLVGGAVRSLILGLPPKDWDLATDAEPEEVMRLFRRVIPTGIKHGTVAILHRGGQYEITTFRIDGKYTDSRRPDSVVFTQDLLEDLRRRDFTINSMAVDIGTGTLTDPHDGRGDCKRKIVRAIGNPVERFDEDGLRILRAVRFAVQLGFDIEEATVAGIRSRVDNLRKISAERIRDELDKILAAETPSQAFRFMAETGMLAIVLPELAEGIGMEQKGMHLYDIFNHNILACDGAPKDRPDLRLAALLHDIGKPEVRESESNGLPRFHRHDEASAKIASAVLKRLKYPTALEKRVVHLVREHMFNYEPKWSDAAVRRFLRKVGREYVDDLFLLRQADQYGTRGKKPDPLSLREFRERIDRVLAEEHALTLKDLKVNGEDLHRDAKIPKGPAMGSVFDFLLEAVLDDPALNVREKLLELAENFYASRIQAASGRAAESVFGFAVFVARNFAVGDARGALLGFFLVLALAGAVGPVLDLHFHPERLVVVGTRFL